MISCGCRSLDSRQSPSRGVAPRRVALLNACLAGPVRRYFRFQPDVLIK